jgi:hypothetical protein
MRGKIGMWALAGLWSFMIAGVGPKPLIAQGLDLERMTVWDGVYTPEQASRGSSQFNANCASCHDGDFNGPDQFLVDWGEDYLVSLFELISTSMPASDPGSLTESAYVDLVAFLLALNDFPSGDQELVRDGLASIRVEGREGPAEVPNSSLVEVVGCLAREADSAWIVNSATPLVRTREPGAPSDEELEAMSRTPLGVDVFELLYVFPSPDRYEGHKMQVKGFLIRGPERDQINVSSLSSIAQVCP